MKFDVIRYQVGRLVQEPDTLEIYDSGLARFNSYTNAYATDAPIGVFETTLSQSRMKGLVRLFVEPPFANLKDHSGRVLSGELYTRVSVVHGSEKTDKLVSARNPVEPHLQTLIQELERITELLRAYPKQTLAVTIQSVHLVGGSLTASVTFLNSGLQSESLRNPQLHTKYLTDQFILEAWPERGGGDDGLISIEPEIVAPDQPRPTGASRTDVLRLEPGGAMSFQIRAHPQWKTKGSHLIRVKYGNFTASLDGQPLLRGTVQSKPVAVVVP